MSPKLLAHGSIDHQGEITSGLIALESNSNCGPLIGMEFLRQSKKLLMLGRDRVILFDEPPETAEKESETPPEETGPDTGSETPTGSD